jgi:hypothetical protein
MTTLDEAEQLERIDREFAEYAAKVNAEWSARWPAHCQACGGWGGNWFGQSHPYGAGSAMEYLFDPCDALPHETCHRCGLAGLDPESDHSQCRYCGWHLNDGVPVT